MKVAEHLNNSVKARRKRVKIIRKVLLLISVLFIAGCSSLSEEEVVEETMENIHEVNNYELVITTNIQRNGNEAEDIYSMEIDMENRHGLIKIDAAEMYEGAPVELYYDPENVYEKTQEDEWISSRISVEEMHPLYFIDYQMIAQLLEFIEQKEETGFEEVDGSYVFFYEVSEEDAAAFLGEWGFDSETQKDVDNIAARFQINESTHYLENVNLELTVGYDDGYRAQFTHELHYKNINELSDIETPDGIENE